MLSDRQIERYSRQIILPQVGGKGQERLLRTRVLVSGDGPWQAQALLYLVAAGVGHVGICGIEHPPILTALTSESQASASFAFPPLNPDCALVVHDHQQLCDFAKAAQLVQQYDLVIAEPNVQLHAVCHATRRPFFCGMARAVTAWFAVYRGYEDDLPCLACEPLPQPETISSSCIDWPVGSFLGTVIGTEAMKWILGLSSTNAAKLSWYQFPALIFHERVLAKNPHCSVCQRQ